MYELLRDEGPIPTPGFSRGKEPLLIGLEPYKDLEERSCDLYVLRGSLRRIDPRKDVESVFKSVDLREGKVCFSSGRNSYRVIRWK